MPSLPSPGDVVRVDLPAHDFGMPSILNRFFIKYVGTLPSSANLNTFCDAVATEWGTNMKSLFGTQYVMGPVVAQDLSSTSGFGGTGTSTVTGTRTGTGNAAGASLNIRYNIIRRYRGGKPKMYCHAGVTNDQADYSHWTGALVTAANTAATNFFAGVITHAWAGASSLQHVSVSWYHGFTVVTDPVTGRARNVPVLRGTPIVDVVTGYSTDAQIGSQRRRNGQT